MLFSWEPEGLFNYKKSMALVHLWFSPNNMILHCWEIYDNWPSIQ